MLGRLPIDPKIAEACDAGRIEYLEENPLKEVADTIETYFVEKKA